MSSSKVKSSSSILNILIIAVGAIFLFRAAILIIASFGVVFPEFIDEIIKSIAGVAALGSQGVISLVLAFWCIISGIALFKEAEWAMGQALVVLSVTVATTVESVITIILNPASFDFTDISGWINLIAFVIGVVGFIWLLVTRRKVRLTFINLFRD
ncbi:unnamed protein product [marine sediment metagenome]|uniref:Uncharacterized protein n=1 Tax=marine sediment metagenome TaxID=412755 RepID=X1C897_9ZZZZ